MKLSSRPGRLALSVSLVLLSSFALAIAATGGYHLLKKYPFGAAEGSTREYFDYITVDSSARRVYVSHGTEIKVLDADTGNLIGKITGLKQDHGVAVATEFGRGFISDGGQGKVIIFDLKTLKVMGEAKADDRGVKNIQALNTVLAKGARPWWDFYGGKKKIQTVG